MSIQKFLAWLVVSFLICIVLYLLWLIKTVVFSFIAALLALVVIFTFSDCCVNLIKWAINTIDEERVGRFKYKWFVRGDYH